MNNIDKKIKKYYNKMNSTNDEEKKRIYKIKLNYYMRNNNNQNHYNKVTKYPKWNQLIGGKDDLDNEANINNNKWKLRQNHAYETNKQWNKKDDQWKAKHQNNEYNINNNLNKQWEEEAMSEINPDNIVDINEVNKNHELYKLKGGAPVVEEVIIRDLNPERIIATVDKLNKNTLETGLEELSDVDPTKIVDFINENSQNIGKKIDLMTTLYQKGVKENLDLKNRVFSGQNPNGNLIEVIGNSFDNLNKNTADIDYTVYQPYIEHYYGLIKENENNQEVFNNILNVLGDDYADPTFYDALASHIAEKDKRLLEKIVAANIPGNRFINFINSNATK